MLIYLCASLDNREYAASEGVRTSKCETDGSYEPTHTEYSELEEPRPAGEASDTPVAGLDDDLRRNVRRP